MQIFQCSRVWTILLSFTLISVLYTFLRLNLWYFLIRLINRPEFSYAPYTHTGQFHMTPHQYFSCLSFRSVDLPSFRLLQLYTIWYFKPLLLFQSVEYNTICNRRWQPCIMQYFGFLCFWLFYFYFFSFTLNRIQFCLSMLGMYFVSRWRKCW